MKPIIKLIILFVTFICALKGQNQHFQLYFGDPVKSLRICGIDTSDIYRVRQVFDSTNHLCNEDASIFLAQKAYADIVPQLKILFYHTLEWTSVTRKPYGYLYALYLLNTSEAQVLAHEYLDTMKIRKEQNLEYYDGHSVQSTIEMLLNLGDYSRYQDFDDFVDIESEDSLGFVNLNIYVAFGSQSPLRKKVYDKLVSFLRHLDPNIRSKALLRLERNFMDMQGIQQVLRGVAYSDPNDYVRYCAYAPLFFYYRDPFVVTACAHNADSIQDTSEFLLTIGWIEDFPSPQAFSVLNDLKFKITNPNLLSILNRTIQYYKPPEPEKYVTISVMIDSLSGFIPQCTTLGWLGPQSFVTQLSRYLTEAKTPLITWSDSILCASKIYQFQQAIDREYRDLANSTPAFVTVEGSKFLYYSAQYILDRLPAIPPDPIITSIQPYFAFASSQSFTLTVNGKNFTNIATVYWNNSPRTTTLISDSILIANISASDIAVVDSPLVVVKNPDGGESNALRFYIIKKLSVTELLDTLNSHLQLCYINNWLGNKQFKELLERSIQNARNKYLRQDSIGCTQELEELQQNIRNEYLVRPKKNDKRYINAEAYRLLTSDITNIISNVLTLPPRTSGTIYAQINSLQTELKRAETAEQISGKILIPALNLMLEIAKKEIQKKDTTGAALQIKIFQQTIKEVYELTQKLKKAKDRIYITATAYISLYYRAEYILEQLTKINNQTLPKLESELEKELQELRKEVVE